MKAITRRPSHRTLTAFVLAGLGAGLGLATAGPALALSGDLSVAMNDGVTEVNRGDHVAYTITIRNDVTVSTTVGMSSEFSSNLRNVSWTCSATQVGAGRGAFSYCDYRDPRSPGVNRSAAGPLPNAVFLAPDDTMTFIVRADVAADALGETWGRVRVTEEAWFDVTHANDEASDVDTVLPPTTTTSATTTRPAPAPSMPVTPAPTVATTVSPTALEATVVATAPTVPPIPPTTTVPAAAVATVTTASTVPTSTTTTTPSRTIIEVHVVQDANAATVTTRAPKTGQVSLIKRTVRRAPVRRLTRRVASH